MLQACLDVSAASTVNWGDLQFHIIQTSIWRVPGVCTWRKQHSVFFVKMCFAQSGHGEQEDFNGHDVEGGC